MTPDPVREAFELTLHAITELEDICRELQVKSNQHRAAMGALLQQLEERGLIDTQRLVEDQRLVLESGQ